MRNSSKYIVSFAKIHCLELIVIISSNFLLSGSLESFSAEIVTVMGGGGVLLYEYLVSGKHWSIGLPTR